MILFKIMVFVYFRYISRSNIRNSDTCAKVSYTTRRLENYSVYSYIYSSKNLEQNPQPSHICR